MKKFIEPVLIKAGDDRVKLGFLQEPPRVDCRVISEDNYQLLIEMSGILNIEKELGGSDADSSNGDLHRVSECNLSGDDSSSGASVNGSLEKRTEDGKICFESNNYIADMYESEEICDCDAGEDCLLKTNVENS